MPKKGDRHRSPRPDTMKCVLLPYDNKVVRVRNDEAEALVRAGKGSYCPKSHWRKYRDAK